MSDQECCKPTTGMFNGTTCPECAIPFRVLNRLRLNVGDAFKGNADEMKMILKSSGISCKHPNIDMAVEYGVCATITWSKPTISLCDGTLYNWLSFDSFYSRLLNTYTS